MPQQDMAIAADRYGALPRRDVNLPFGDREEIVLRYWSKGDLTPLQVANSLARQGSAIRFA